MDDQSDRNTRQHHDFITFTIRSLGFTLDHADPTGLADWWTHPTMGEFMVVHPLAGDYWTRTKELVGDLATALDCPPVHELQLEWISALARQTIILKEVASSPVKRKPTIEDDPEFVQAFRSSRISPSIQGSLTPGERDALREMAKRMRS